MANILSLAPEMMYMIGSKLDVVETRILRLVCHNICVAVEPLALAGLFIGLNSDLDSTLEKLEAYATGATVASNYVRKVTFRSTSNTAGSPGIDPSAQEHSKAMEQLETKLQAVLSSLTTVQTFRWDTTFFQPSWTTRIFGYVASRNPRSFEVDFGDGFTDLTGFDTIAGLRSLSVMNVYRAYPVTRPGFEAAMKAASIIIANSPDLKRLEVSTSSYAASDQAPTLHDLLPSISSNAPALALKHLALDCMRIMLDDATLPHLRSLESLCIRHNLVTPAYGSNFETIWRTLSAHSIYLVRIDLSLVDVDESLLDYLQAHRSIREIVLDNSGGVWNSTSKSDLLAVRFWDEVLPTINQQLDALHIVSFSINKWCFNTKDDVLASPISRCTKLKELKVSIAVRGDPKEEEYAIDQWSKRLKENMSLLESISTVNATIILGD